MSVVSAGSGVKRRISASKGTLAIPVEHDDDNDDFDNRSVASNGGSRRRSLGGRRRSSFGSHSSKTPVSSAEQSRIAEMYKTVIKMSSENVCRLVISPPPHPNLPLHTILLPAFLFIVHIPHPFSSFFIPPILSENQHEKLVAV